MSRADNTHDVALPSGGVCGPRLTPAQQRDIARILGFKEAECACVAPDALECAAARGGPRLSTPETCGCDCHENALVEVHQVSKDFTFEAAHRLPWHGGKCARVHGHSYHMTITLEGTELATTGPSAGMLQDHFDVSKVVDPIVRDYLDHHYLNESTGLENPTVELLCRWLWGRIAPSLPRLESIHVRETCTASYTYRRKKG